MTERLYYNDPNQVEFEATIGEVGQVADRFFTVLDRSAFYPTSGGQPHYTGQLNNIDIVEVTVEDDKSVRHWSNSAIGEAGDTVRGVVDTTRRRHFRQQHTAQHIVSHVFHAMFSLRTMSVHLGEEYSAIEFNADTFPPEKLKQAEKASNDILAQNLPIEILIVDATEAARLPLRKELTRTGKIRVIRIGDIEYSPCGGTHCNSTAEVRTIKLTGIEKIRGRILVKFLAGEIALEDYLGRYEVTSELSRKFTCHFSDLPEKVISLQTNASDLRQEVTALGKELLPVRIESIAGSVRTIGKYQFASGDVGSTDAKSAIQVAQAVAEKIEGAALVQSESRLVIAVSSQCGLHAGKLTSKFNQHSGLKGGGGQTMAQIGGAENGKLSQYVELFSSVLNDE